MIEICHIYETVKIYLRLDASSDPAARDPIEDEGDSLSELDLERITMTDAERRDYGAGLT